jgi:hypothetical protein
MEIWGRLSGRRPGFSVGDREHPHYSGRDKLNAFFRISGFVTYLIGILSWTISILHVFTSLLRHRRLKMRLTKRVKFG